MRLYLIRPSLSDPERCRDTRYRSRRISRRTWRCGSGHVSGVWRASLHPQRTGGWRMGVISGKTGWVRLGWIGSTRMPGELRRESLPKSLVAILLTRVDPRTCCITSGYLGSIPTSLFRPPSHHCAPPHLGQASFPTPPTNPRPTRSTIPPPSHRPPPTLPTRTTKHPTRTSSTPTPHPNIRLSAAMQAAVLLHSTSVFPLPNHRATPPHWSHPSHRIHRITIHRSWRRNPSTLQVIHSIYPRKARGMRIRMSPRSSRI